MDKVYIDREALVSEIKRIYCADCNNYNEIRCRACGTDDALRMVEDAPTSDVVPKAVIAEIFAEIEVLFFDKYLRGNITASLFEDEYDELKKKYTEDEEGENNG